MTDILLSWHGAIVCRQGGMLLPASIEDVVAGRAQPVEIASGHDLPFELVPAGFENDMPVMALRAGPLHISCREGKTFLAVGHCAAWEHFLIIDAGILPSLTAACAHNWLLESGEILRPRLEAFVFVLGEARIPLHLLCLSCDGEIMHLDNHAQAVRWPSPAFDRAIASILPILGRVGSDQGCGRSPWADPLDLSRQLLLTMTDVTEIRHLFFLARLCLLIGLDDEAALCIAALQGTSYEIEALALSALHARMLGDEIGCTKALNDIADIIEGASSCSDAFSPSEFRECLGRPFCHASLWPHLEKMLGRPLDPGFDDLLVPERLPPQLDFQSHSLYTARLEEKWGHCPADKRQVFLDEERRLNGQSHSLALLEGHKAWLEGERDKADAHYSMARSLSRANKRYVAHFNAGLYTWRSSEPFDPGPRPLNIDSWRWYGMPQNRAGEKAEKKLVLAVGCDQRYFAFLPRLIASLIQACIQAERPDWLQPGSIQLVVGLAGGTDRHVGFLAAVSDALQRHRSPVALAFAQGSLRHCDPASFSCLRYLLLPEVTRLMSGPVMTLDADALFPADFVALADALTRDFDYGFRLYAYDRDGRQIAGEPWGFGAGVSYFGETALVPVIAQELHDYIVGTYHSSNPTNWCIDQCALSTVYHRHIAPRWNALRIRFMDDPPPIVLMPHHLGMDKKAFSQWDEIVPMSVIYRDLGLDPDVADALSTLD
ncbi:hypothetical protein ACFFGF_06440 [Asaia lannensis]|uniref:Glycosyltransferase n=1 Tax=Asaia lannensis NBRC 102526 TaxID=1307926 RepID=A0ABT1CHY0_9PROT|nr:hypothetical protein [Asaia lannensis]MCO6159808.1 hypothetical protein [Asaia lannensis NBRC 102526]GBQ96152.1 hypothetical protein AA102526_0678 [Asaia lannensis NBRC 102526]